eukprot:gene12017-biopygen3436
MGPSQPPPTLSQKTRASPLTKAAAVQRTDVHPCPRTKVVNGSSASGCIAGCIAGGIANLCPHARVPRLRPRRRGAGGDPPPAAALEERDVDEAVRGGHDGGRRGAEGVARREGEERARGEEALPRRQVEPEEHQGAGRARHGASP